MKSDIPFSGWPEGVLSFFDSDCRLGSVPGQNGKRIGKKGQTEERLFEKVMISSGEVCPPHTRGEEGVSGKKKLISTVRHEIADAPGRMSGRSDHFNDH